MSANKNEFGTTRNKREAKNHKEEQTFSFHNDSSKTPETVFAGSLKLGFKAHVVGDRNTHSAKSSLSPFPSFYFFSYPSGIK